MACPLTIYKDVAIVIETKGFCIKKIGKRVQRRIHKTYGDLPVYTYNKITGKFEDVDNPRGRAYAARNRMCYRKKK